MYRDFYRAFRDLFRAPRSRGEISALLLVMALLPVSELAVTHLFSQLILRGAEQYQQDPSGVVVSGAFFFAAFAASRALHHVVRLNRVRVFRRGFERSDQERPASQEAWSWAAAFELSTALVSLIQIVAFCALFAYLDVTFGLANIVIGAGVLWLVARIYRRQLQRQIAYLAEGNRPGGTGVGERVGTRIRDAELGAIVASLAMAGSLGLVLVRAIQGGLTGPDAIVLFIGLRMLYSQVGNLSASAMRFARAKARLAVGSSGLDDEDEFADPDTELDDLDNLRPAQPTAHRAQLISQMLIASQRGESEQVHQFSKRLRSGVIPTEAESNAESAAEAFADLASPTTGGPPLRLLWWARPFPGTAGNWISPAVLRAQSGRPVHFQTPTATAVEPHLVMVGSVIGSAHQQAIVVGTGALHAQAKIDPAAQFISVRGPLTAAALRACGGPAIEAFGDPALLAPRFLPLTSTPRNGRLAFVRHHAHDAIPVTLGEEFDELSPLASHPDQLVALLSRLSAYDAVVTSDVGTVVLCHAYGIPCVPVTFDGAEDHGFVLRDHGLGAGLGEITAINTDLDLSGTDWRSNVAPVHVEDAVLDGIQDSLDRGIEILLNRTSN